MRRANDTRPCYLASLRRDPSRAGSLMVELRVETSGEVSQTSFVQNDLSEPEFE